jgi:hypothetical protein
MNRGLVERMGHPVAIVARLPNGISKSRGPNDLTLALAFSCGGSWPEGSAVKFRIGIGL